MARRSHGEGSIRKRTLERKDGSTYTRYFAVVTSGYQQNGNQQRLEGPWRKTKPEANRDRKRLLSQLEQGILSQAGDTTLSEFLDYWLEQRQHDLRYRSYEAYEGDARNHIKPSLGRYKLTKLTPLVVQTWQTKLLASSGEYVTRKARACLSAALAQAVQWQILPANPVDAVAAFKMPDAEIRVWEPGEVKAFLEAAKEHRLYPAYFLTLSLGLRLGELRGLKWEDIVGSKVHIQRAHSGDRATPNFGPPKTKKGDRFLPIPEDAFAILETWRDKQKLVSKKTGRDWRHHNLIVTTRYGTPPARSRIVEPFEKIVKRAELPVIRFHDLRHTAASLWIASGMDVATVSARLGHADINITLRVYAHAFKTRLEQSSLTMDELLDSL